MQEKRVKSAWEIALERAERLGTLSAEEQRQQEEKEYRPIGRGLADRALSGLPLREVEVQLSKHAGTAGAAVRRGLVESLAAEVGTADPERAERALAAIRHFFGAGPTKRIVDEIERLRCDHAEREAQRRAEENEKVAAVAAAVLEAKGIAGSAVRPNEAAAGLWRKAPARDEAYEQRLRALAEELAKVLA